MKKRFVYAGTYTDAKSEGIYRFSFAEGMLSEAELFCRIASSKYLCSYEDKIVALCDLEKGSGVALIGQDGTIIDSIVYEEPTSCYVTCRDDQIFTANFHAGTISRLRIADDRIEFMDTVEIKKKAGCHQVLFSRDRIMVPCLFLDKVIIFDRELNPLSKIDFPAGSGPRHGVFSDDGRYLYLVSELSNELFVIDTDTDSIVDSAALLETIHVKGTAAVRKRNNMLYVSTRGENVISVVDLDGLQLRQVKECGGDHPRDILIVDDYLLCANRFSDSITSYRINEDGSIGDMVSEIVVPEVVSLICA